MDEKIKLYGFNNLTKTLSFNIYDVCYTKSHTCLSRSKSCACKILREMLPAVSK